MKGKNSPESHSGFSCTAACKLFPDLSMCQQALMGRIADRAFRNIKNAPALHGFSTKSLKRKVESHQNHLPDFTAQPPGSFSDV
jgi:hypothetical protein